MANLRTTARRDGDFYVVNGEKTFITSGMRADYITTAVRTGGPGRGGVSLLVIEGDTPGLSRTPLKKMGWWASDTATLHFDDCRVPAGQPARRGGRGFSAIMHNFNGERLTMAAGCIAAARVCLDDATEYAKQRHTFGKPLAQHQVIRHKLVDMAQKVAASQAMLEMLAWRLDQGESPVAEICMLKNQATQTMAFCASEAVQIFGGAGFMRGIKVERIYREVKVNAIGGGSEEIMKDLAPGRWDCETTSNPSSRACPAHPRLLSCEVKERLRTFVTRTEPGPMTRHDRGRKYDHALSLQRRAFVPSAVDAGRTRPCPTISRCCRSRRGCSPRTISPSIRSAPFPS